MDKIVLFRTIPMRTRDYFRDSLSSESIDLKIYYLSEKSRKYFAKTENSALAMAIWYRK